MTLTLLDNIAWNSLYGAQAHLATGSATARRYARGQTPFLHVRCENPSAHALYLSRGFREHQVLTTRAVSRSEPS